jgi:hypothetical protein
MSDGSTIQHASTYLILAPIHRHPRHWIISFQSPTACPRPGSFRLVRVPRQGSTSVACTLRQNNLISLESLTGNRSVENIMEDMLLFVPKDGSFRSVLAIIAG